MNDDALLKTECELALAQKYEEQSKTLRAELTRLREENEKLKHPDRCPQCGESTIHPRDSETYCEECGWPDENRVLNAELPQEKLGDTLEGMLRINVHSTIWNKLRNLLTVPHEHHDGQNECMICEEPLINAAIAELTHDRNECIELRKENKILRDLVGKDTAQEIISLRAELARQMDELKQLKADNAALRKALEVRNKTLEPFADAAQHFHNEPPFRDIGWGLKITHFRAARAALEWKER